MMLERCNKAAQKHLVLGDWNPLIHELAESHGVQFGQTKSQLFQRRMDSYNENQPQFRD